MLGYLQSILSCSQTEGCSVWLWPLILSADKRNRNRETVALSLEQIEQSPSSSTAKEFCEKKRKSLNNANWYWYNNQINARALIGQSAMVYCKNNNKSKWHTRTPTHGLASTLRMRTAMSPGQWQPWTAVSALAFKCVTFYGLFCR